MLGWSAEASGVVIAPLAERRSGLLGRLRPAPPPTLDALAARDDRLAAALGDLEACAEEFGETVERQSGAIRLSHRVVAACRPRRPGRSACRRPCI